MIPLLFLVLITEGVVALLLVLKIGPLRELTMNCLDQLKSGKGPATIKTLACTMSLIFLSSIMSMLKIRSRGVKMGTTTPMDQVLWRTHLLEASLMGYSLFLGFIIDRMHHYLRKLLDCRDSLSSSKLQLKKLEEDCRSLKEKEEKASQESRKLKNEMCSLTDDMKKLREELEVKGKALQTAEANVGSLQKQSEVLLLEYDRLFEDNQNLLTQSLTFKMR